MNGGKALQQTGKFDSMNHITYMRKPLKGVYRESFENNLNDMSLAHELYMRPGKQTCEAL